ncbi:MAG: 3-oxo-5-alpha-steroid 4-dehydrogenase [Deltaproteobacteria bacterium]|nr:MAG: 3-oxo-5-alpha-steroid 4-dehydrogenase [Deltaproteobacteria bacterium]
MDEVGFFHTLLLAWFALAAVTFVLLLFVRAPYGRYARRGWGPILGKKMGWVIMELPSALGMPLLFLLGNRQDNAPALVFLALWEIHYLHRTFVFPLGLRGSGGGHALATVVMAIFFNSVNVYLNGRWLFFLGPRLEPAWLADPRFLLGGFLFAAGFAICKHSDAILRALRSPGESGYKIPRGGLFRWVTCPNYLGEIIEWCGWALLTWSLAGLSFAAWTVANLAPRARQHHRWYRQEFPDYPRERRALLPFIC